MEVPCRTKNVNKYYKVIAEVGSGTYGKVYKAECLKTNDLVALKKIDTRDAKIMSEGIIFEYEKASRLQRSEKSSF